MWNGNVSKRVFEQELLDDLRKKTLTFSLGKASEYIGGIVADSPLGLVEPSRFG